MCVSGLWIDVHVIRDRVGFCYLLFCIYHEKHVVMANEMLPTLHCLLWLIPSSFINVCSSAVKQSGWKLQLGRRGRTISLVFHNLCRQCVMFVICVCSVWFSLRWCSHCSSCHDGSVVFLFAKTLRLNDGCIEVNHHHWFKSGNMAHTYAHIQNTYNTQYYRITPRKQSMKS